MRSSVARPGNLIAAALFVVAAGVAPVAAQTVSGQARVVQTVVSGLFGPIVTTFADTGALESAADARHASAVGGAVGSLVNARTLHATAIGMSDSAASQASAGDVSILVAGVRVAAEFVMSRAAAGPAGGPLGATVTGLSINGVGVPLSGAANETIAIPGGRVVANEQQVSGSSAIVNALHVVVYGVADIVIASASAGVQ